MQKPKVLANVAIFTANQYHLQSHRNISKIIEIFLH